MKSTAGWIEFSLKPKSASIPEKSGINLNNINCEDQRFDACEFIQTGQPITFENGMHCSVNLDMAFKSKKNNWFYDLPYLR